MFRDILKRNRFFFKEHIVKPAEIVKKLNNGAYNARFEALYGADEVEKQTQRYLKATELIPKELANGACF